MRKLRVSGLCNIYKLQYCGIILIVQQQAVHCLYKNIDKYMFMLYNNINMWQIIVCSCVYVYRNNICAIHSHIQEKLS